jgi:hypothetical protein
VIVNKGAGGGMGAGIAILALAVAGVGYYAYQTSQKPAPVVPQVVEEKKAPAAPAISPDQFPSNVTPNSGQGMKYIAPVERTAEENSALKHNTPFGAKEKPTRKAPDTTAADGSPDSVAAAEAAAELDQEEHLAVLGTDAVKSASKQRDAALFAKAVKAGAWAGYQDLLVRSLSGSYGNIRLSDGRTRFDAVWNEPVFYQDFLRWQVLNLINPANIGYGEKSKTLFSWLLNNNDAMEEVLLTVKPGDDKKKVVALLGDYQADKPDQFAKYFNLALACSVVFDKTVSIPAASQSERFPSTVDPMKRYEWYIDHSEKGKMLTSLERMTARDLVWVVCAPVADTELDWAIEKMHLSRKGWGATYDKVEYLMERAVKGINPYSEYSLAEILKKGGICGDRSYFSVNTARAHGIPAMTIAGETDLGGHAWAGIKESEDKWNTMVGRIGGASNGQADNPQLGGQISEQEIWLWNDRAQQSAVTTRNVFRLLWLADYLEQVDQVKQAEDAIRLANTIGRPFSETWLRLYGLLVGKTEKAENKGDPELVKSWEEFVADMKHEFRENPRMADLATKAEKEYIFPFIKEEDARKDLARERRRIERNSGEQKDLIATSVKQEAELIKSRGDANAFEQISNLYEKSLRAYGGSITGFKTMAEDYMSFVGEDQTVARKAAREIELAFDRVVKTGSKDWFRANTETSIYKMICGYYRQGGDESKAQLLEKQYQRLLRDAERGAL